MKPSRSVKPSRYHKLSAAQKRVETMATVRDALIRCPGCDTGTTVRDLLDHVRTRCTGRAEPHASAPWVAWREAAALMGEATLVRAVDDGTVRSRASGQELLLRDIVLEVARLAMCSSTLSAQNTNAGRAENINDPGYLGSFRDHPGGEGKELAVSGPLPVPGCSVGPMSGGDGGEMDPESEDGRR